MTDQLPEPSPASAPLLPALAAGCRRLTLDVELGIEPLSGVLYAGAESFRFAGWLALASVLDRLSAPPHEAPERKD